MKSKAILAPRQEEDGDQGVDRIAEGEGRPPLVPLVFPFLFLRLVDLRKTSTNPVTVLYQLKEVKHATHLSVSVCC